ncbi:1-(5-phosphoribosyl)-5-[(5-phosphoribosylamino)methylideneamino]imidazole-4-carboxamide isomerase [Acetonema longum]|uniref:1-(5-phosphoribosyl)-5-[(5-phosphoribosylamino)methylideneamino] imidazole-4-carboxamide isomerase n=1 Tax=Acetonema longum DSM 6540 TaxID=1009370 RepID=F7NEP2_9FIRM|nr:1-(5-phosphoribosyl)-5-[(5-phosphoribosylamino)methylideneamino]imidazole-4-carboxamide isomerase [Acetonema longum]EGO65453.1 1-(5-phosphoribosyl)-5-[(5-phosphoribosylamino)methylideneamino] imidazole-4-carboxamide isomerase [Acetonema longum DSM 6540]
MILFPAIDIRGGKCVRLTEGRFDRETVFAGDPVAMALQWTAAGAEYLHVVDLDGAVAGTPVHEEIIAAIVRKSGLPVQVGGGIRTLQSIEALLSLGVARVILGSAAVKNPALVEAACRQYDERIVVGIDARQGRVAVEGWVESSGVAAVDLAKKMAAVGVRRLIYTDIGRDGTLAGVNLPETCEIARAAGIPVIASGGVRDMRDILVLQKAPAGIEGVIIGKALYTGTLSLKEALRQIRGGV